MQKATKLQWAIGLVMCLILSSCSVSNRYHQRGLNIQWRSGGKHVYNSLKETSPSVLQDLTDVKATEVSASTVAEREVFQVLQVVPKAPEVTVGQSSLMVKPKGMFQPIQEFQRKLNPPPIYENQEKYHRMANKSVVFALLSLTPFVLFFLFQLLSIYFGVKALNHVPKGHRDRKSAYTGIALSMFLIAFAICFWLFFSGWGRI
jgi:hypothetical protein